MEPNLDRYYTDLDKELQQLALVDWPTFVNLIGEENVVAAKVCLLKSRGKSLNQISNKLAITKSQSETRCKKCPKL
jgi:hypothetical protein